MIRRRHCSSGDWTCRPGSSFTSAYYCATRDPGPFSALRVQQLPGSLPKELAGLVKIDRQRNLLGVRSNMSSQQRDLLLAQLDSPRIPLRP